MNNDNESIEQDKHSNYPSNSKTILAHIEEKEKLLFLKIFKNFQFFKIFGFLNTHD